MRLSIAATMLAAAAMVAPASARAQQSGTPAPQPHVSDAYRSVFFDLHPELTKPQFEAFAGELGSILRFRQIGDITPLGRGNVDLSVQFASTSIDDSNAAWNNAISHPTANERLGRSMSFPRVVARVGVSDRVDIGGFGGFAPRANYGLFGVDTRIALLTQGPTQPVSVSIRPALAFLVAPSEVWAGNASIDLSVGRTFGALSPYVGIAASSSGAMERSADVDLDPVSAGDSLAFAGISYRWRMLVASAEVEKGDRVTYGFRIGTRF